MWWQIGELMTDELSNIKSENNAIPTFSGESWNSTCALNLHVKWGSHRQLLCCMYLFGSMPGGYNINPKFASMGPGC